MVIHNLKGDNFGEGYYEIPDKEETPKVGESFSEASFYRELNDLDDQKNKLEEMRNESMYRCQDISSDEREIENENIKELDRQIKDIEDKIKTINLNLKQIRPRGKDGRQIAG